jgi:tetratricopeptide (TPR) repeat protein
MNDSATSSGNIDQSAAALPITIGKYRILRLIGEGGMGIVYEAQQEQPSRTVALKVIKPGLASAEILHRFEQESQALGRLQHPGIAQIYEAGTANTGLSPQPYFAMELVRGQSLREHAEAHHLDTRQRLEIMADVCDAVHHAHQRGLIHRDLKPGNIIVDETGQPKILDFGVARATDRDPEQTLQTHHGQLVGTLAYMSPEQVSGDPLDVDTRSDIYALGTILYELLAGRLPYTVSTKLHEAVQTIREQDPAALSSTNRMYRGDIETIVGKALEKDKTRRYASAAGLASDIRRHLSDQPIAARPASLGYQLQKFSRRHKALVAGIAAVFIVLVAGIFASTWQATRAMRAEQSALVERDRASSAEQAATKERDRALKAEETAKDERNKALLEKQRADTESATATAINEFLQNDLLAQASAENQARPDNKPDPDLKVRTALDRAAARIAGRFEKQPLVEASIRTTVGTAYKDLGLFSEAERHLERALELRRKALGADAHATLDTMSDLADIYVSQGKYALAQPLLMTAVSGLSKILGNEHADTLDSKQNLAELYNLQGKYDQAARVFSEVLEVRRRIEGEESTAALNAMNSLAVMYTRQGKYEQAERLHTRGLALRQRVLGEQHPQTMTGMNNLGALYLRQGKYTQAEATYVKLLDIQRRVLGEEHPSTLTSLSNLALAYRYQGRYAEAEPLGIRNLESRRRLLGEEHPDTLTSLNNLAGTYHDEGKFAEAEPLYVRLAELLRRALGETHPNTLGVLSSLTALYVQENKYTQAEAVARDVLARYEKALPDTWNRYNAQALLGASLAGQHKYGDAEPLLLSGYNGMKQREASIPASTRPPLQRAGQFIVQLYRDWNKPEKEAEWRAKLSKDKSTEARR